MEKMIQEFENIIDKHRDNPISGINTAMEFIVGTYNIDAANSICSYISKRLGIAEWIVRVDMTQRYVRMGKEVSSKQNWQYILPNKWARKLGYKKVVINGEEYKLTPKWYKEYLSATRLWKKAKETDIKDIDISELVDIRDVKVRVSYSGKDRTLTDSFGAMIESL